MATVLVSSADRHAVNAVFEELRREADQERRSRGELPGIYGSIIGNEPDGRLSYLDVPPIVIERLRKHGIPFDVR